MKILKTILAMCLFSVMGAYAAMPSQKTVKVATAEGLLRALESNQRIVISEGVQIMLTPTISDDALCKLMDINEINTYDATPEPYEKKTAIGYYDNFDGRQLVVGGFKNLTIEGEEREPASSCRHVMHISSSSLEEKTSPCATSPWAIPRKAIAREACCIFMEQRM